MSRSRLHRIADAWQRFWHARASPTGLAAFRIVFAICAFYEVFTTKKNSVFAIEGGFHAPYVSWITPVSVETYELLHGLQLPLLLLVALGLWMRPAIAALLALQGYIFFTDYLNFRNHPYFFLLVLLVLLFSPAAEALSVRSILLCRRTRKPLLDAVIGPDRPLTCQRLIQVQLCIVYFYAGLHKLNAGFLGGHVLAVEMEAFVDRWGLRDVLSRGAIERLTDAGMLAVPSALSATLELLLPFVLWNRRTKTVAIAVGIVFHLSIAVTMNIFAFSLAMIASYLLFLEPETLPRLVRARWGAGGRTRGRVSASDGNGRVRPRRAGRSRPRRP